MAMPHFMPLRRAASITTIHVVKQISGAAGGMGNENRQFKQQVGKAIASCRQAKGMTQEQVAERLGVEQETISRFERGAVLPPWVVWLISPIYLRCRLKTYLGVGQLGRRIRPTISRR